MIVEIKEKKGITTQKPIEHTLHRLIYFSLSPLTYHPRHFIEREALGAAEMFFPLMIAIVFMTTP